MEDANNSGASQSPNSEAGSMTASVDFELHGYKSQESRLAYISISDFSSYSN